MLSSCNALGQRVNGSGHTTKEERQVGNFSSVILRGSMDVYVTSGPAKAAVIEAEDNIIPYVELENSGGELRVGLRKNINLRTNRGIKVYLTTPTLDKAVLSGSGNFETENTFTGKNAVSVSLSGSGNIIGAFNAPSVDARISGSGNIKLKGNTKEVELHTSGSGDFDAEDLLAENASVHISGSGDAKVHASVKLDANISGSGDVTYKGNPQVNTKVRGSGSVKKD